MIDFAYRCIDCGREQVNRRLHYLCSYCSISWQPGSSLKGVLEVIFDYAAINAEFDFQNRDWSLFSVINPSYYPNYPVGNTPFIKATRLVEPDAAYQNLWLKCDHLNPSGSLKDRASFLVTAQAKMLGAERIVVASTGNAASALAAVAAAAGIKAKIFVPESAPLAKLAQIKAHGAELVLLNGSYDDAFKLSIQETQKRGGINRNTAYNPLTIEGKKTVGFEVFKQNNFKVPDAIIIPVGDGVILAGVYKAFLDLLRAKLIDHLPQLIAVQAEGSSVIHQYMQSDELTFLTQATTRADSIAVAAPSNAHLAKQAMIATNGFSLLVSDQEILKAQQLLAKRTGQFVEPASAASVAGLFKIQAEQQLAKGAQIVLLLTGHGLKDINSVIENDKH